MSQQQDQSELKIVVPQTHGAGKRARSVIMGATRVTIEAAQPKPVDEAVAADPATSARQVGDVYLVVQKGNLFQRAYPDIEVLLDGGRYLVVFVPEHRSDVLSSGHAPCFDIRPLPEHEIVYQRHERTARLESGVSDLAADLDRLDVATFNEAMSALTSLHSRFSTHDGFDQAIEHCRGMLEGFGFQASVREIDVPGLGKSSNLIGRLAGASGPPKILVTAHLDSINEADVPDGLAPGADDNASGSAGVMTLAEALAAAGAAGDVLFVLFGGEEQGLHGSIQFVDEAADFDPAQTVAVINMDMIGSINPPQATGITQLSVLLEGSQNVSGDLLDGLLSAAHTYTSLAVSTSLNPWGSDHMPFIDANIPAALTIEGEDRSNTLVHSADDAIGYIDPELAMEILRMNMAFILQTLRAGQTS